MPKLYFSGFIRPFVLRCCRNDGFVTMAGQGTRCLSAGIYRLCRPLTIPTNEQRGLLYSANEILRSATKKAPGNIPLGKARAQSPVPGNWLTAIPTNQLIYCILTMKSSPGERMRESVKRPVRESNGPIIGPPSHFPDERMADKPEHSVRGSDGLITAENRPLTTLNEWTD